jgi:hypothetical protein
MFSDIDETVVVVGFGPGDGRLSSGPRLASSAESSSFSSNINCRSSSSSARDASGEKAIPRLVNSSNISFRLLGDGGVGVDDEEVSSSSLLLLFLSVEDKAIAVVEAAAPTACL